MPTTRHRKTRSFKGEGLTRDQREHLIEGRNLLTVDFPFKNERHRKDLYFRHRDELLSETGPNRRCHGWWSYSAPEPRRRIVGGNPDFALWDRGLSFGRAKISEVGPRENGYPVYESQKDYLIRNNLYER